jgi:hypothetical protein
MSQSHKKYGDCPGIYDLEENDAHISDIAVLRYPCIQRKIPIFVEIRALLNAQL